MTTNLDDRVRVLMARLGDATPIAPEFESLTAQPLQVVAAPLRPTRHWAPLVAAAAAVGLVVGAIAFHRVGEHGATTAVSPSTKQIATDLPDGWSLVTAVGPGTLVVDDSMGFGMTSMYATGRAPFGPVLRLLSFGAGNPEPVDVVNALLPDGRRATLMGPQGMRTVDVEVVPGTWVTVESREIDDETLLFAAAGVTLDTAGSEASNLPFLDDDTVAALGMSFVGETSLFDQPFLHDADVSASSLPEGVTITRYAPIASGDSIDVTTFVPTDLTRATLRLFVEIDADAPGGSVTTGATWSWRLDDGQLAYYVERGGLAHLAIAPEMLRSEVEQLVASLAPASDDEWAALVGGDVGGAGQAGERPSGSTAPAVEATVVETTAAPQQPVSSTVDIEVAVATTETTGEYVLTLTWPDGSVTEAAVSYVGRSITLRSRAASGIELSTAVDVNTHSLGSSSEQAAGYALIEAHVAASSSARWMVVVAEGVRYRVELVQPNPSYPVKVAALVLPVPTDGSYLEPGLQTASGIAVSR